MLSFLKKCLGPKANPIGADFGSDSVKLAQVGRVDNDWRLLAAASVDVPPHVRHDMPAKMAFLAQTIRELVAQGGFIGRNTVMALPAAAMFIQHLRLPKTDEETLAKSIPWEVRGKLPIDPCAAVLRHHVAGEVFQDQEPKQEVIVMAAGRDVVSGYLNMAARAKLDVVGMNVEPRAIVDCFGHVYRRKSDAEVTNCFIDIGFSSTRAVIACGAHILFARSIPIGSDHLSRAVATALQIELEQARLLRWQLAAGQAAANEMNRKQEVESEVNPPVMEGTTESDEARACEPVQQQTAVRPAPQLELIERAMLDPLRRLVEELDFCRRYYEASFPNRPVGRLIFVGGEARQRWTCQQIAQELGIAAQVGDPLVRMGRVSTIPPESGIDRRQPQPNWAVAIGLSMGPVAQVTHRRLPGSPERKDSNMAHDNQLSFLPEDYLAKKAQQRASIICGFLFLCVMGGLGSAFWLSEQATRRVDKDYAQVQQQYVSEAQRIQQVREMQNKQRRMAQQAEITASLLERVPRSFLLAEFTNSLPAGVSLLDLTLDSKVAAKPVEPPKTAFEQKKAAATPAKDALPALPEPKKYEVTIKVAGVAINDGQVAQYLKKLSQSRLLKDVNLNVTEEYKLEKQVMRKFEMEMVLNPTADAHQAASAAATSRVADVSVEK